MSIIISVINNKGGVGKTTSTAILAELLSYLGKKTLLVDLDGQSNLSMQFQSYTEDTDTILQGTEKPTEKNIAELFRQRMRKREELEELIKPTPLLMYGNILCLNNVGRTSKRIHIKVM